MMIKMIQQISLLSISSQRDLIINSSQKSAGIY